MNGDLEAMGGAPGRQWGLQKMGVNQDLARLTTDEGDHYMFVATKTCVVRAISEEKLAPAGLVSCLNYYLNRRMPNGMRSDVGWEDKTSPTRFG